MRKLLYIYLILISCTSLAQGVMTPSEYAEKYAHLAIKDMQIFKIPASITLAQGIYESGCGGSRLAIEANNHFGIKCKSDWTGQTITHDDDQNGECFRKYSSVEDSYSDHSLFLSRRERYASLFKLDITDYKGWAYGLKEAGYATNPTYAQSLIKIIEDNQLYKYDVEVSNIAEVEGGASTNQKKNVSEPVKTPIELRKGVLNGVQYVIAHSGDSFTTLSIKTDIPVSRLLDYNDLEYETTINDGTIIYTMRKKSCSNSHSVHYVKNKCTLYDISQHYGIRLKSLMKMNPDASKGILPIGTIIILR